MKLKGRRESTNVEDRRGQSSGLMGGKGGIGIIIAIIVMALGAYGIDLSSLTGGQVDVNDITRQLTQGGGQDSEYKPTKEEKELERFSKQILASTEDVWTEEFRKMGKTYEPPTLVLFSGGVRSGCGDASSSTGPFYCSADQCVYIDLSFFMSMKKQIGAGGDFAYAYVIAHEVGHHVQYLLGTLDDAHHRMAALSEKEANKISVMLELQADNYAGVWAHHENARFKSLEDGDIEEALDAAQKIGDDYLQKKARGYAVPETFNHGTSAQRTKWLKRGLSTGDIRQGNTFAYDYDKL